jgi:ABC-type Co2+ transport system permease subunit
MHIEPGIVTGAKLVLSYATGIAAGGVALKLAAETVREQGIGSLAARTLVTTGLVLVFFEILPHFPVGVSEVHLILGSTLFLLFGAAPAAFGLAFGLLLQGLFFEPQDIPQYGMNVTTLLVPLFGIQAIASRIIARNTAYVDLKYRQALALSTTYQAGVIGWVAFWALYGSGFAMSNLASIASFAAAYALVIVIEPMADLAVLALAKSVRGVTAPSLVTPRLHNAA